MTLRLRTFGAVFLERDRVPLTGLHTQKRRLALLAYLAAADHPSVTRDKLLALLWPESDEASARHALSQLVYALKRDLGAEVIIAEKETLAINSTAVGSDVREFDHALIAKQFEEVAELYRGPFLDGFHLDGAPELDRWADEERRHRAMSCARAVERLAEGAEARNDHHRAVEWWRRRAAFDPGDGRVVMRLMQALTAVGDRHGALQAARVYETVVRDELGAMPDAAVSAIAREIKSTTTTPGDVTAPATQDPGEPGSDTDSQKPGTDTDSQRGIPRRRVRTWLVPAATIGLTIAALALVFNRKREAAALNADASTVVVIGDLEGPDSVLSMAVREAVRAELSSERRIMLTSDLRLRELRTLMRIPPETDLRVPQLLDVATRGGAHIAVAGSVMPMGSGAQIVVDLYEPTSGRTVGTLSERAVDPSSLLASMQRIGRSIRSAIGRTPVDSAIKPLPAVTTTSLAALKSYALARQAAWQGERAKAVDHGERALMHDSAFVLAHYLVGDLLWFLDQQGHSEAHLTKAFELSATVSRKEQLVIRARNEQLVRDNPDSALAYWQHVHDAAPNDPVAYEGRAWALRALGRHEEAAAAADTAMRLDPSAAAPNTNNAIYSFLAVGDTASALALGARLLPRYDDPVREARFYAALFRRDHATALALADSTRPLSNRAWRRQLTYLSLGDPAKARIQLDSMLRENRAQFAPRALLNQAWIELRMNGDRAAATRYARAALDWLRIRDLSPPAVARLSERIGTIAAQAGDAATLSAAVGLVQTRDQGRSLRSYVMAQRTLAAAQAFSRGDWRQASELAEAARHGVYFWRSLSTIVQLQADAERAAGDYVRADSLDRLIATHQIVDSDFEVWVVLRDVVRTAAAQRRKPD